MMDDFPNKMDMSLDEIILQQQKKKGILRTNSSDDIDGLQGDEELLTDPPRVTMNSTNFLPEKSRFLPRRAPGLTHHEWLQLKNMNRFNHRRTGQLQKRFPGIPLIKIKRGFRQGILGNNNYKVRMWRQPKLPRYQTMRFSADSYPLTSNYLQQFNEQNCAYVPRRGPGSTGSRGSLCSNCSRSSVRSHTSYRSIPSNRSTRSLRTPSSNSQKTISQNTTHRFKYFLNKKIQQHIQHLQENKALRLHNSSRENLIDEPAKCKPQPRQTWCTLHHRFRKYIMNPIH